MAPQSPRTLDLKDLKGEISQLGDKLPKLSDDDLFVVWFLFAFVTGNKESAVAALTGKSGEKGIDAVHIDDRAKLVTVVQGKYRKALMSSSESRDYVIGFAMLAQRIAGGQDEFADYVNGLEGAARSKVFEARERILKRSYRLNLHYATLGRCAPALVNEAKRLVRKVETPAAQRPRLAILTGRQIISVLADYLDGVAPPVPSVELAVDGRPQEQFDQSTGVSSWIFSVNGAEVGQLVDQYGVKLFARNIRGYLGETTINQDIRKTLRTDPSSFWYLNNGITFVCDHAELESSAGRERLNLRNPQIINGQQTSYALSAVPRGAQKARVSVRVISIARDGKSDDWAAYDAIVSRIVEATNSQNRIKAADLRSNDRIQVGLERDLHQLGYHYQRKRAAPSEVAALARQHEWKFSKEALAKAAAGTESATLVRRGVDVLFEAPHYHHVFKRPTRNLLCRWWLSKSVGAAAWGSPERQWAKYVVLRLLWEDLSPDIMKSQSTFIDICENSRSDQRFRGLQRAIEHTFKGALAFYRAERGTGKDRLELSPFFKRQDVYERFSQYWRSQKNVHKPRYTKAARETKAGLKKDAQHN